MVSDFNGSIGSWILTVLEIKAQVLHRVRLHVKVPGWLLNLNALLTKKLPMFLSRLNKMIGGRENICFGVISENCEVFKNDIFDCKFLWLVGNIRVNGIMSVSSFCEVCSAVYFLGAVFACGHSGVRVAVFFEKLAHFLAFVVKVRVVTAEASQSEKLNGKRTSIQRSLNVYFCAINIKAVSCFLFLATAHGHGNSRPR